ncbi:MAG: hypothetical protein ACFFCW_08150 [Candidatus Hodarchaeota archaeon]
MKPQNLTIVTTGKLVRTAIIREEWYEDVEDPESFVSYLRQSKVKADIFSFFQRLPEIKRKFDYYMEWENIAVIPIISFDHWWTKQIHKHTRQAVKRAAKKGVEVKVVEFNHELVKGITEIYNESPIRQGKPFRHYGKDLHTIKKDHETYLDRSMFIGAYYKDELIGFVKLVDEKQFADIMQIISKMEHRDKSPNNILIAKAVEICYTKGIPYLEYGTWTRGGLDNFKRHNGFESIKVPRYYIPLTYKGTIALKLRLHHGTVGIVPEKVILRLIDLRKKWYTWRFGGSVKWT